MSCNKVTKDIKNPWTRFYEIKTRDNQILLYVDKHAAKLYLFLVSYYNKSLEIKICNCYNWNHKALHIGFNLYLIKSINLLVMNINFNV